MASKERATGGAGFDAVMVFFFSCFVSSFYQGLEAVAWLLWWFLLKVSRRNSNKRALTCIWVWKFWQEIYRVAFLKLGQKEKASSKALSRVKGYSCETLPTKKYISDTQWG